MKRTKQNNRERDLTKRKSSAHPFSIDCIFFMSHFCGITYSNASQPYPLVRKMTLCSLLPYYKLRMLCEEILPQWEGFSPGKLLEGCSPQVPVDPTSASCSLGGW